MRHIAGVLLLWLFAACQSKSPNARAREAQAYEERRAELTALIDKILALAVDAGAPLGEDKVSGVDKLDSEWAIYMSRWGNAVVLSEWQAKAIRDGHYFDKDAQGQANPGDLTPGGVRVGKFFFTKESSDFKKLAWWTVYSPKTDVALPSTDPGAVEAFLAIRYVVVIRVFDLKPATVTWSKDGSNKGTYQPGHVVGEARIFDVDGKDHGGVRFSAENSGTIELRGLSEADDRLMQELDAIAWDTITTKLRPQIPALNLR